MAAGDTETAPLRHQCAVYGIGVFCTSMYFMAVVIVPLWVERLELTPFVLGIVLGCRPLLPLFLSIHTGVLIDRYGARRVMLFFAALGVAVPLLFPVMPWVWAVIALQLLSGMSDSVGWLGAQTLVGQLLKGSTRYAARLGFIVRIGHVVAPVMVGAVWDLWGPWPSFALIALWGVGVLVSALMLPAGRLGPAAEAAESANGEPARPARRARDMLPRAGDYLDAFRLTSSSAVLLVLLIGMMTHVGNSLQATFYVVWLQQIGIPGTLIGLLVSVSSVAAGVAALLAGPLTRRFRHYWLLLTVVWTGIVLIAITPLLGTYMALMVVLCVRSAANGVHQPLVITMMLRAVGPAAQGRGIGLRGTANRISSISAPVVMGALAEWIGIEASFYVIGIVSSVILAVIARKLMRHPEVHEQVRER